MGIVAAGAVGGSLAAANAHGLVVPALWLPDAGVTTAFAVAAAVAYPRSRGTTVGAGAVAVSWAMAAMVPLAVYWHRGALVLLILAAPHIWPRTTLARAVVVVYGLASLVPMVWADDTAAVLLSIGLAGALAVLHNRLTWRRLAGGWLMTGLFAAGAAWHLVLPDPAWLDLRFVLYSCGLVAVAGLVAASEVRPPAAALTDDVVRLVATPTDLQTRMAAAAGDPTLRVEWTGASGPVHECTSPGTAKNAAVIPVTVEGRLVARIVLSGAIAADPRASDAVARATRLASESMRLDAELERRAAEVALSNERVVRAGDADRAQVRRMLDDDVSDPLDGLRDDVLAIVRRRPDDAPLQRAVALFRRSSQQLSEVALGIPPAQLTRGLGLGLGALAADSPIPVTLVIDPALDDDAIATALYFVCAEALSNAVKHSAATEVRIVARLDGGTCYALIADDGCGGAEVGDLGGLAGMRDRIHALRGTFDLRSDATIGTSIALTLPMTEVSEPHLAGPRR